MFAGCGSSSSAGAAPSTAGAGGAGGGSTGAGGDAADAGTDAPVSKCGKPGDKGNSLGVGMFCDSLKVCSPNPKAKLCTTIAADDEFFCTFACKQCGPPDQCGEDATCQCSNGGCGCFPNHCFDMGKPPPPDDAGCGAAGSGGASGGAGASGAGGTAAGVGGLGGSAGASGNAGAGG